MPLWVLKEGLILWLQKKTARTFSCSCREASDANYFRVGEAAKPTPQPEYLHHTIDPKECKYRNRDFFILRYSGIPWDYHHISRLCQVQARASQQEHKIGGLFMASIPESAIYKQSFDPSPSDTRPRGWFRVGVLAATSALAGGLAAAWYY